MRAWQEDHLQEFEHVRDERTLLGAMSRCARSLDFDFCTLVLRLPFPLSDSPMFVTSSYPASWLREYSENNYFAIDPVVQQTLQSQRQLTWGGCFFDDVPEFYEAARARGVRFGYSQPCHAPNGVIGILSLARSGEAISPVELRDKQFKLAWLTHTAQLGIARHPLPKLMPALEADLSDRELAVLRWIANGKSSDDIAGLLHISKRTVDFHANNAVIKLRTPNRTAAAVLAAMRGLL